MEDVKLDEVKITRGKLLKRGGAATALLAGGALLTAEPAFASKVQTDCYKNVINSGDQEPACGACNYQTTCGDGTCGCIIQTNGCCFCHQGSSCSGLIPCTKNSQCPKGYKCAASCCFDAGFGTLCHPPCGTAAAATVLGKGPVSIRR
jgi:hypothetical protein